MKRIHLKCSSNGQDLSAGHIVRHCNLFGVFTVNTNPLSMPVNPCSPYFFIYFNFKIANANNLFFDTQKAKSSSSTTNVNAHWFSKFRILSLIKNNNGSRRKDKRFFISLITYYYYHQFFLSYFCASSVAVMYAYKSKVCTHSQRQRKKDVKIREQRKTFRRQLNVESFIMVLTAQCSVFSAQVLLLSIMHAFTGWQ